MSEFNFAASLQTELKKHVEIINRIAKQKVWKQKINRLG
jgi:hypothetical protein